MNRSVCLTTIFELAADGLLVTDQQGLIQLANPALCTLFGFLPDELSDINIDRLINDVKASGSGAPVRLPDGLPAPVSRNGDFTGRKKDGSPFPVRLSFAKLTDNGDIYYAGSVHDLSREEKNKHALIHEQQLNQVKGRIVSLPPPPEFRSPSARSAFPPH